MEITRSTHELSGQDETGEFSVEIENGVIAGSIILFGGRKFSEEKIRISMSIVDACNDEYQDLNFWMKFSPDSSEMEWGMKNPHIFGIKINLEDFLDYIQVRHNEASSVYESVLSTPTSAVV